MSRMADVLKTRGITAVFTSLRSDEMTAAQLMRVSRRWWTHG